MNKLTQNFKTGEIKLENSPSIKCNSNSIKINTTKTLISVGTEKMLVQFAKSSLLEKAKAQPDKVKQVLDKIKTDGFLTTIEAVRSKLADPIPLGYSNVGVISEIGNNVIGFKQGDRVLSNGPHSEYVSIGQNLVCKIPDNVSDDTATFTVVGAIGLQGIRLLSPTLGEQIAVIGLGLIGQLTVQMLIANGCSVLAVDIDESKVKLAETFGAKGFCITNTNSLEEVASQFSNQRGVDGVLITASTKSNEPIESAAKICRKRGKIVLVGVTGLDIPRHLFYDKELSFQVSCSYGPGRYEAAYEEKGLDYPIGFVRWTEQRNFEAVLELMAKGKLQVGSLITHKFPFEKVEFAYHTILTDNPLGVILEYSTNENATSTIQLNKIKQALEDSVTAGFFGVGNFGKMVLLPALKESEVSLHTIVSSSGLPAAISGKKFGFFNASSNYEETFNNPEINTIFICTRHSNHSQLVIKTLNSNKHVFVEKPLALSYEDLKNISVAYKKSKNQIMVGFNRRFSQFVEQLKQNLTYRQQPLCISYMVNAGSIPQDHWVHDPEVGGGRIIGEGCHFMDLLRFIVGKSIKNISSSMTDQEDCMTMTLEFIDNSIGTVHYFSNGSKLFPKERIEVFSEGKVHEINNFKSYKIYGTSYNKKSWKQDKGHKKEVKEFINSIKTGTPLIPFEELIEVSVASIAATQSAKTGEKIELKPLINSILDV